MERRVSLVIEDDPLWRRILSDIISEAGLKVYQAADGFEGITKAYRYKPDILVVDYFLPKINGGHIIKMLRKDPIFESTGMILISFNEEYVNEFWAQEYGADLFLMKREGVDEIKNRLNNFLILDFRSKREATKELKRGFLEELLKTLDEDLRKETINRGILELLEYVDDEEYVMRKLESIFRKFSDYKAFYSMVFSLTAGRLYIFPVKSYVTPEPVSIKETLLKLVRKPLTPAEWRYYGNFKANPGEPFSIDLYLPVMVREEVGMLAFTGIDPDSRGSLLGLFKDITQSLGMLFNVLNRVYDYKVAATEDSLTGLLLKTPILKKLSEILSMAKRGVMKLSVSMLDIDDFKKVNDTYGHVTGDKVLKEIGSIIRDSIRETDFAGRYGGEEFLVVLVGCDSEKAKEVVERLLSRVRKNNWKNLGVGKITMSAGIAEYREGVSVIELVEMADKALYKAKRSGKDRVEIYGR